MFYVYEWFIVDTLEVFYVGKGTGMRRFEIHNRSKYFKNVYNKYNCAVHLVYCNLTNEQACELEKDRICEMRMKGQAKCNFTNGGTGFSTGSLNPRVLNPLYGDKNGMRIHNIHMNGENNPFYGKKHSENTKQKISKSRKGKGGRCGKDNPMWNDHRFKGKNNGMYGRTGFSHPNSKIYQIEYTDGTIEILEYKECEKKFGIAFSRIYLTGGIIQYKHKSKNSIYEGIKITRLK